MAAVLRRVAKWLGVTLLVMVVLFAALIALVKHQEAAYEKRAVPFLAVVMSDLATWDYSTILPHFAEPVASAIPEEEGRALFQALSRLGALLRYDKPDFRSVHAGANIQDGAYKIVLYVISATFENGDATITIQLLDEGDRLSIHSLNIDSPVILGITPGPVFEAVSGDTVSSGAIVELPLQRGFYVMSDTPCGEASNATLMLIRRAGMNWARSACDFEAIGQGGPTSYRAALACMDLQSGEIESWTVLVEIPDAAQFSYGSEDSDDRTRYRYCEQSSLPEPWRDNDISDLVGEGFEQ